MPSPLLPFTLSNPTTTKHTPLPNKPYLGRLQRLSLLSPSMTPNPSHSHWPFLERPSYRRSRQPQKWLEPGPWSQHSFQIPPNPPCV